MDRPMERVAMRQQMSTGDILDVDQHIWRDDLPYYLDMQEWCCHMVVGVTPERLIEVFAEIWRDGKLLDVERAASVDGYGGDADMISKVLRREAWLKADP